MKTIGLIALVIVAACDASKPPAGTGDDDADSGDSTEGALVVHTTYGDVEGFVDADGITQFLGVPYAKPPVGNLRWRPPQDPEPWPTTRSCKAFAPSAPQWLEEGDTSPLSEDCLYLNIWTPKADSARRPVVVFIHGGALALGQPDGPWMRGTEYAKRGVVFVNLAYRLGPLGFLYLAQVAGATDRVESGNLGLLDQRKALQFVHDNIAGFGGDPDRITIVGESAGGWSVSAHMAMPESHGLFQRAIAQSGGPQAARPEWGALVTKRIMQAAGVTTFAALQSLTWQQLIAATLQVVSDDDPYFGGLWRPTIDGVVIKKSLMQSFADGDVADVPLMIGTTRDEMRYWVKWAPWATISLTGVVQSGELYGNMIARAVEATGKTATQVQADYLSRRPGATQNDVFFDVTNDLVFRLPSLRASEKLVTLPARQAKTWMYLFTWKSSLTAQGIPLGSFHSLDLPFTFGLPNEFGYGNDLPPALISLVMDTWVKFATDGDPNNASLPSWPPYNASQRATMILDVAPQVQNDPLGGDRTIWSTVADDPFWDTPGARAFGP
jgi:para-nitrobenzyl esterase